MNSYGGIFTISCIAGKLSWVDQTTGHYVEILVSAKSCSGRGYKLVRLIRDRLLEFGPSRHQTKIFLSSKTSIHVANMAGPTDMKQERISGGGRAILQNLPNCGAVGSPKMGSGRRWKIKGRVREICDMSAKRSECTWQGCIGPWTSPLWVRRWCFNKLGMNLVEKVSGGSLQMKQAQKWWLQ